MKKRVIVAFALMVGMTALVATANAAEPEPTTVVIPDLHCAACAKKLTTKLTTLTGVSKAEADVKAKTITLTPKAGAILSPKVVWEAIEQEDEVPTKLTGPSGTFTKKPQS